MYIFWFLHQTTTFCSLWSLFRRCISFDSYIKPQLLNRYLCCLHVVYLLIPTSNHNLVACLSKIYRLYIFWFLHQTTTVVNYGNMALCCISFDSYIKPQLNFDLAFSCWVVYLLIPTSNHNRSRPGTSFKQLYIFWFLHQTATTSGVMVNDGGCISFDSYIKPQPITSKYQRTSIL